MLSGTVGTEGSLMPKFSTRLTASEQLDYIAKLAIDEALPIKVRVSGGLDDYDRSAWMGDRRKSHYLVFEGTDVVHAFHHALGLFVKACTRVPLANVVAALRPLVGED